MPFELQNTHLYVSILLFALLIVGVFLAVEHEVYVAIPIMVVLFVLQLFFSPLRYRDLEPDSRDQVWGTPLQIEPEQERVYVPSARDREKRLDAKLQKHWEAIDEK